MRLTDDQAKATASALAGLRFFPSEPAARELIARKIQHFCAAENLWWFLDRMMDRDEWTGPEGMREVYCERFRPLDEREKN